MTKYTPGYIVVSPGRGRCCHLENPYALPGYCEGSLPAGSGGGSDSLKTFRMSCGYGSPASRARLKPSGGLHRPSKKDIPDRLRSKPAYRPYRPPGVPVISIGWVSLTLAMVFPFIPSMTCPAASWGTSTVEYVP